MMSQNETERQAAIHALQWHLDHGVDAVILDTALDRTAVPELPTKSDLPSPITSPSTEAPKPLLGAAEAIIEAQKLAASCETVEALSKAIENFEGLSLKKMATNMVFADGDMAFDIMVIGEAPNTDEDVQGKPFVGQAGQLLDKILASIHLARQPEQAQRGAYLTNMLNWRPPGNRTPTDSEIAIALPFIERHIALVKPKVMILCGGVAGKALLRRSESISKLRGTFHDYQVAEGHIAKAVVTYHPTYLLRTPAQKKAVWADMLMTQDYIKSNL